MIKEYTNSLHTFVFNLGFSLFMFSDLNDLFETCIQANLEAPLFSHSGYCIVKYSKFLVIYIF